MTTGIYLLKFADGSIYIGQSIDIEKRYLQHINKLKNNTHTNYKVYNKYLDYGVPSIEVLIECSSSNLDINEIEAIEIFDSINNGLNIAPAAGDFPILNGETNGFSKYSNEELMLLVEYLVDNLNTPLKELSKNIGIHYSTVKNIANGTSHKWLAEKIPDKYKLLISHKGKRAINTIGNKGILYKVKDPCGNEYTVSNISKFSIEHGLNQGALGEVLRENTAQHKGWTLIK